MSHSRGGPADLIPATARGDSLLPLRSVEAILVSLDGVMTRTFVIHAAAWKTMFDAFLRARAGGHDFKPFDAHADYRTHFAGRSWMEGVKGFLGARGISLPDGAASDEADRETVHGLIRRKDAAFRDILMDEGLEIFPSSMEFVESARARGLKVAAISTSLHCGEILEAAGLAGLFDAVIGDGSSVSGGFDGLPDAEQLVSGAARLGAPPERTAVILDTPAGVEAARSRPFGLVIAVDRLGRVPEMTGAGADLVVADMSELLPGSGPPLALNALNALRGAIRGKRLAVFLDYDGTLSPIVDRPEDAHLSPEMRAVLEALVQKTFVAFVSGRMKKEVQDFVKLDQAVYAGSHGFDISGPDGLSFVQEEGQRIEPVIQAAARKLAGLIGRIEGVLIEDKRFAVAVHYRLVSEVDFPQVEAAVDAMVAEFPELRKAGGKKVFELRPRVDWHKGKALLYLLEALKLDGPDVLPLYLGDDETDEDAFACLLGRGVGVLVNDRPLPTSAMFRLRSVDEVRRFLEHLVAEMDGR